MFEGFNIFTLDVGVVQFLLVSSLLFVIGVCGIFLNRKNVIIILFSIELILLSVNMNFVTFSNAMSDLTGQIFVLFVLTIAAAEVSIALAIIVVFFRKNKSIAIDEVSRLRG